MRMSLSMYKTEGRLRQRERKRMHKAAAVSTIHYPSAHDSQDYQRWTLESGV